MLELFKQLQGKENIMNKNTELTSWKNDMKAAAVKTANSERPNIVFIGLQNGIMSYQGDPLLDNKLKCIIIATSFARTCFMRPYNSEDSAPPECFANAIDEADLIPHKNVIKPFAKKCGEKICEWAVFGTAFQGEGPRCKTRRKLVVMPISGMTKPEDAELAILVTPPTSGKNYSRYASKIAAGQGLPLWAVQTCITCKPHVKNQFEIVFAPIAPIVEDSILEGIHFRIEEAEDLLLRPYSYETEEATIKTDNKKVEKF